MDPVDTWIEELLLLILFLISTAANSLALLVFSRRPSFRTISNKFVINLLATNLATTTLLAPALIGERSVGGIVWQIASDSVAAACSLAALLAVLLIAVDQHHAVTDPLRCHARLLQRRPGTLIASAWTCALLAGALKACVSAWLRSSDSSEFGIAAQCDAAFAGAYLAAGVVVPAISVCLLYARIYRAARSSGLRARAHGASAMQLHEPTAPLPDLVEEGEGLTLKIDVPPPETGVESDRAKYGPFLLPPERPRRCPSVASLRSQMPTRREGRSSEDLRRLPAVASAPTLAHMPLLPNVVRVPQSSRITSLRCRISNASLFRYREESRAARVGLFTTALVLLHAPHALVALMKAAGLLEMAEDARTLALALLVLAAALSPFLFALRSRRVQREARRILLPEKSPWKRAPPAATAGGGADGQQARAALELLKTLSPGSGSAGATGAGACARGSFSSGASTQLSSASDE